MSADFDPKKMKNVIEISDRSAEYYVVAERWKSDLEFFKIESSFLCKLKTDYYFTRLSDFKNMEELQKVSDRLSELQVDIYEAGLKVDAQLHQLTEVAENSLEENYRDLALTNATVGHLMISLTHEYQETKKQIFAHIEAVFNELN